MRAFFAVKRQAQDDLSVMIAAQAAYLTARDVHPTPLRALSCQLDAGSPAESCWNGTATLENRDGEWLIDDHEPASLRGACGRGA